MVAKQVSALQPWQGQALRRLDAVWEARPLREALLLKRRLPPLGQGAPMSVFGH
jgi:hypothetical protein